MLTIQEVAAKLEGREYREELSRSDVLELKAAGIVAVYGASDDLCEFDGAICDEAGCNNGATIYLSRAGLPDEDEIKEEFGTRGWERYQAAAAKIEAEWCKTPGGPSWTYSTAIPHETFNVMEDGEVYCVGIVFLLSDLPVVDL